MPLGAFLLGMVGSLTARVLLSLGFSVVTITGVTFALDHFRDLLVSNVGGLPADIYDLFMLAGGGVALNILLSAVAFRLSYWSITKSVRILGAGQ